MEVFFLAAYRIETLREQGKTPGRRRKLYRALQIENEFLEFDCSVESASLDYLAGFQIETAEALIFFGSKPSAKKASAIACCSFSESGCTTLTS